MAVQEQGLLRPILTPMIASHLLGLLCVDTAVIASRKSSFGGETIAGPCKSCTSGCGKSVWS